jgi:hypothetical protein
MGKRKLIKYILVNIENQKARQDYSDKIRQHQKEFAKIAKSVWKIDL